MWTRLKFSLVIIGLLLWLTPTTSWAAAGVFASGGGKVTVGQAFTVTVKASGATFDSLQGTISVSGPVTVNSFSAGSATWLPGKTPSNGGQFVGIVSPTSSVTVATIKLTATKAGSGSVSVSGVRLARSGSEVGSSGGSASYTASNAPTPPGSIEVSSSTHPNQEESYPATTVELSWKAPSNGASGYSYLLDRAADTTPPTSASGTGTTAKYDNLAVGTHYFHIRANNQDGWGSTTHYKINIKRAVDESLAQPTIQTISTTDNYQNDLAKGTLTGLLFKGTGPAGLRLNLTFSPDLGLSAEKYPAPTISETGTWELVVSDPVKAGFYTLVAEASNDTVVSRPSETVYFEISVAQGGSVRLISEADATATYIASQQSEQARVAAANARQAKLIWAAVGGGLIVALVFCFVLLKKRLLKKATVKS